MLLIWYADPELHPNARVVGRGVQNLGQNDNPGGQWGQRSIFRTTKGVHRFLELLLNNRSKTDQNGYEGVLGSVFLEEKTWIWQR